MSYAEKNHMLSPGDTVAAGVSGGADSVCLLLILCALKEKIPFRLLVVHVNHMMREDADADAAFVEKLCEGLSLPCRVVREDVNALAERKKISSEEAGREARYKAFRDTLYLEAADAVREGKAKIAVAHNANDRAETMLFHLFRGTGPDGLCGIRPRRCDQDGIEIIRPLLCLTREEIEKFLRGQNVGWREDATNGEDAYTRNRIRHHILPYAEREVAGGAVKNMARAAEILTENADFVKQETLRAYQDCLCGESGAEEKKLALYADKLNGYHPFLQKRVILHCLEQLTPRRRDITQKHVTDAALLFATPGNRGIELPCGIRVRREYEKVWFEDQPARPSAYKESSFEVRLPMPGEEPVSIRLPDGGSMCFCVFSYEKTADIPQNKYTKWFDYDKIDGVSRKELQIRTRAQGDYLCFDDRHRKKSIQDYMVEEKIPKGDRDGIWLLAERSHVLWVTGYRISAFYKIDGNTKYVLQVQLGGERYNVRTHKGTVD